MVGLYTSTVCVHARGQMQRGLIYSRGFFNPFTLSLWTLAVVFLVPLVLQVLFSFAVLAFQ